MNNACAYPFPRVCYEIFVRSFCDSDRDGIGDLNGITSRLDYLQNLGIEGIWLTPVHPSPSYHKYDVVDYYQVDREYGTLDDFRHLLAEAHARGIRIYMDLVIHHTSILHRWFEEAQRNPESRYRNYYRWMSDAEIAEMGVEIRELTQDAHTVNPWHRIAGDKERFFGIFSREMADLDFDNPEVREEVYRIVHFWRNEMGVDGFRLDAARHIYPIWEDWRNPDFWAEFGREAEKLKKNTYLLGEVWADAGHVAPFFKGLTANFNFGLCWKIEDVLRSENHLNLVQWIQHQRGTFQSIRPDYVDAIMLSNHDQQRIGSTLNGDRDKMKLAAAILLTLPGQPYIYYGEELGMLGRKPDPFLREPFLWGDPGLEATWKMPRYSRRGRVASLRETLCDPSSLYYCYQNLIRIRNACRAIGDVNNTGIEEVPVGTPGILAYVRQNEASAFLVVHNLGRATQRFSLAGELSGFATVRYASTNRFSMKEDTLQLGRYNSIILELTVPGIQ